MIIVADTGLISSFTKMVLLSLKDKSLSKEREAIR